MSPPAAAPLWLRAAPVLFLLIWSGSFVFLKLGLRFTDPLTFLALRWVCVVSVLLVAFAWVRPRLPTSARAWGNLAMVVLAPLAYLLEPMHVQWTPALIGSLTYLVFATSLVAITLLLAMIRQGEASRVSALFFLVPPVTALIAHGVLGEAMAPLAWLGMALAALGIYLVMRPAR